MYRYKKIPSKKVSIFTEYRYFFGNRYLVVSINNAGINRFNYANYNCSFSEFIYFECKMIVPILFPKKNILFPKKKLSFLFYFLKKIFQNLTICIIIYYLKCFKFSMLLLKWIFDRSLNVFYLQIY